MERFEEDDDPEAAFGEADFNLPGDHPRPNYSEGSMKLHMPVNGISESQESHWQRPEHEFQVVDPTITYEISNGDKTTQGLGIEGLGDSEYNQQPSAFKFGNDSSIYGEFSNPTTHLRDSCTFKLVYFSPRNRLQHC